MINRSENYPPPPAGWGTYSYERNFGTHDWIAYFALKEIFDNGVLSQKWKFNGGEDEFWTESRKIIYLYATEGPDRSAIFFRSGDRFITGPNDKKLHHIYFDSGTKQPIDSYDASDRAMDMAKAARDALNEGECEVAAFYMGMMTHYIADVSNFMHVLENIAWSHGPYEDRVGYFTSSSKITTPSFFTIDFGINPRCLTLGPENLAVYVAKQNRFGDQANVYYSAKEFDGEYSFINYNSAWDILFRYTITEDYNAKKMFDTVEWNLNNAIDACAGALDWVVTMANFDGCERREDEYAYAYDQIVEKWGAGAAYWFTRAMVLIGQWAVLYAAPVTAADKLGDEIVVYN